MIVKIVNCFHWVGYHLTTHLLEQGFKVHGVDTVDTTKKELFSLFVGRNDRFILDDKNNNEQSYDVIIEINRQLSHQQVETIITLKKMPRTNGVRQTCSIKVPIVIGEWMPKEKIAKITDSLQTDVFLNTALRIEDVLAVCFQWLSKETLTPQTIKLLPRENSASPNEAILENNVYLHDNMSIQNYAKEVLKHYNQYKDLY